MRPLWPGRYDAFRNRFREKQGRKEPGPREGAGLASCSRAPAMCRDVRGYSNEMVNVLFSEAFRTAWVKAGL